MKTELVTKLKERFEKDPEKFSQLSKENSIWKDFASKFPAPSIAKMSLEDYCMGGTNKQGNFSWWLEVGLQPVFGTYSAGSARSHILFRQKKDGNIYKHRHLKDLDDNEALEYVLKVTQLIASAPSLDKAEEYDDNANIYKALNLEPRVTMGDARKLRVYGGNLDYSSCNTKIEIQNLFKTVALPTDSDFAATAIHTFKENMENGDIVIVTDGNHKFRAIGRITGAYSHVKPWITLIINNISPLTQSGATAGISMLFPMEQLFERYVFKVLKERMENGYSLRSQSYAGWLARHRGQEWFKLQPDLIIQKGQNRICVMDTKWKRLDESALDKKYGISQAVMYQLYAYGQKCLPDGGALFLIYPKHHSFQETLPPFWLSNTHTLWVVPFCLETDQLITGNQLKISGLTSAITLPIPMNLIYS